jgi:hypothetical protein
MSNMYSTKQHSVSQAGYVSVLMRLDKGIESHSFYEMQSESSSVRLKNRHKLFLCGTQSGNNSF